MTLPIFYMGAYIYEKNTLLCFLSIAQSDIIYSLLLHAFHIVTFLKVHLDT